MFNILHDKFKKGYYNLKKIEDYETNKYGKYVYIDGQYYEYEGSQLKEIEDIEDKKENFFPLNYKGDILLGYHFNENIYHFMYLYTYIDKKFLFVKNRNKVVYLNGKKIPYIGKKFIHDLSMILSDIRDNKILNYVINNFNSIDSFFKNIIIYKLIYNIKICGDLFTEIINIHNHNYSQYYNILSFYIYKICNKYKNNFIILYSNTSDLREYNINKIKKNIGKKYIFVLFFNKGNLLFYTTNNMYFFSNKNEKIPEHYNTYNFDLNIINDNLFYKKLPYDHNIITAFFIMKIVENEFNININISKNINDLNKFFKYISYQIFNGIISDSSYNLNLSNLNYTDLNYDFSNRLELEFIKKINCFTINIPIDSMIYYFDNIQKISEDILSNYICLLKLTYNINYFVYDSSLNLVNIIKDDHAIISCISFNENLIDIYLINNNQIYKFNTSNDNINNKIYQISGLAQNKNYTNINIKVDNEQPTFLACLIVKYICDNNLKNLENIQNGINNICVNNTNARNLIIGELLDGKLKDNVFGEKKEYKLDANYIKEKYKFIN